MVQTGLSIIFITHKLGEVMRVADRIAVLRQVCERVEGLTVEHADAIPYLLIGTVDEIVEKLLACHDRWGISYFVVRELEAFAPVVAAFR